MGYKVFADSNVYLDFLLHRGEWKHAEEIFKLAEQKQILVFTSASSLLNIMYILNTHKVRRPDIIAYAAGILKYTTLINPDNAVFRLALTSDFTDLEDAVQYFTALAVDGINYFITSNIRDFKKAAPLPVLTPKGFLKILNV